MVPDKFQHEIQKGADEGSTVGLHLSPRFPEPTIHLFKIEKNFTAVYLFFIIFLGSKIAIYYPQASIMAAQATEAFSPQKRTYRTSKRENSLLFSIFMGHSPPPLDPDPATHYCGSMRIRIHNPDQYFISRTYICSPDRCIKS
jgi:hypothetical protein